MTPTPELRFVEREVYDENERRADAWKTIRILQQKWIVDRTPGIIDGFTKEEWRDVPLVKEDV